MLGRLVVVVRTVVVETTVVVVLEVIGAMDAVDATAELPAVPTDSGALLHATDNMRQANAIAGRRISPDRSSRRLCGPGH